MKLLCLLVLTLSLTQGFNLKRCEKDVEGLVVSYSRAVIDWNLLIYYKQAIQEMGYALQFLGSALIDCNPLSVLFLEQSVLITAGTEMTKFDGPVDGFTELFDYVSDENCEEKLNIIHINAQYYLDNNSGLQQTLQSLHDFMVTCRVSTTLTY
ncbi:hypothetical protein SteCoe_11880 [Stentor coeruleus]|uniref:Uncharacterized protein n=1 Tax=Stentor coeruleus TaxID=5963 RepID=A0A1R2CC85_9CILI|nr:hypothetical protein SteCoe_11880 [Stentor coeruleus]